ncbi:MAG: hypothetical protein LBP87_03370 [Planctomycetaceae bacterium]|nr:hypothetical protein [Planctomycetaceae bacterium]
MELHTDDEVIAMLRCIGCSVAEFREVGQVALNHLSDEQQQFVYSLFNSEDNQLRHNAIYAVYRQETWIVPYEIFEKLKNIYLNDPNVHIRKQSIMTLFRTETKTISTGATFRRKVAYLMITNSKGSQCFAEGLSPTIGRRTRRQGTLFSDGNGKQDQPAQRFSETLPT